MIQAGLERRLALDKAVRPDARPGPDFRADELGRLGHAERPGREAHAQQEAGPDGDVLVPLVVIHVVPLEEIRVQGLPLQDDVAKELIRRDEICRRGVRRAEAVLAKVDAERQTRGVFGARGQGDAVRRDEPKAPRGVRRLDGAALEIVELVAPEVRYRDVRRPGRRRRIKRAIELELPGVPVRVVPVQHVRGRVRKQEVGRQQLDRAIRPVLIGGEGEAQLGGGAQEVLFAERDAAPRGAAAAAGRQPDLDGPGVLRDHVHVDDTVVRFAGDDRDGTKEPERSQVALGFREAVRVVRVALIEQQKTANRRFARHHVQRVGAPVDEPARRVLGSEDVRRRHLDASDAGRLLGAHCGGGQRRPEASGRETQRESPHRAESGDPVPAPAPAAARRDELDPRPAPRDRARR